MTHSGLTVTGVTMRFAGLLALDDINLTLGRGEVLGLIGPNGSGKSTLVNVISGILTPTAGTVTVDGTEVTGKSPALISRHGVARSFQTVRLFQELSVRDNVAAVVRRPDTDLDSEVDRWLHTLGLADLADRRSGDLAYGLQRRLEIARALATHPHYVLLDEPAAGLNDEETEDLEAVIRSLAKDPTLDCGVLIIDHDMRLITSLCDRLFVLFNGTRLAEGEPSEVRRDRKVIEAYLGGAHQQDGPPRGAARGEEA